MRQRGRGGYSCGPRCGWRRHLCDGVLLLSSSCFCLSSSCLWMSLCESSLDSLMIWLRRSILRIWYVDQRSSWIFNMALDIQPAQAVLSLVCASTDVKSLSSLSEIWTLLSLCLHILSRSSDSVLVLLIMVLLPLVPERMIPEEECCTLLVHPVIPTPQAHLQDPSWWIGVKAWWQLQK